MKITINNKAIEAEKAETILQVAQKLKIEIPTLCYHPALKPYGACRLCLVEITKEGWNGWSRLVVSCAYPIEEGLIVNTDSPKVIKARKFVLELLLTRCPEAEIIQQLASKYGITKSRFYSTLNTQHTLNCILCGLCVRVCNEIIGEAAISFAFRGHSRKVIPPFDKPSEVCLTCGACAYVCPTGTIKIEDIFNVRKVSISKAESELVQCNLCNNYFVPLAVSEKVKNKLTLLKELAGLCPECRRKIAIKKMLTSTVPLNLK